MIDGGGGGGCLVGSVRWVFLYLLFVVEAVAVAWF